MMVVVAIGGSMGTLLRYQILLNWPVTLGEEFPLPVIITNLIASLFLGIFLAVFHQPHGRWSTQSNARAFLTAGVVGGLATLSLPMVNVPLLIKNGYLVWAILIPTALLIGGTLTVIVGLLIGGWRPHHDQLPAEEEGQ